jgi:hypothetical protein
MRQDQGPAGIGIFDLGRSTGAVAALELGG